MGAKNWLQPARAIPNYLVRVNGHNADFAFLRPWGEPSFFKRSMVCLNFENNHSIGNQFIEGYIQESLDDLLLMQFIFITTLLNRLVDIIQKVTMI